MKKGMYLMIILLFLALTGCEKSQKEEEISRIEEKEVIEVWTSFGIQTPGTHYKDLWKELEVAYNCEIDVKAYSTEQMKSKLRTAIVCNELPDVFFVWGGSYPEFLFEAGACMPIQEQIAASGMAFEEEYIIPYEDGNNYIIPCMPEDYVVTYYNQELVELMGLQVPTTWEELLQLVEDVKAYNAAHNTRYTPINLGNKNGEGGELLYCMLVERLEPNAYEELKQGVRSFEDEVFVRAAEMIDELEAQKAFSYDFMEVGEKEAIDNFANNEAVIFPARSSVMYYLMDEMGEDAFHMIPFPSCNEAYEDNYGSYMIEVNHTLTCGLCINAVSPRKEQAAQICLEFAKMVNERNVSEYGYINMTDSEIVLKGKLPKPVEEFQNMLKEAEAFSPCWYAEIPLEEADVWRNITKKLYAGELDVEGFIEKGQEYLHFNKKY